MVEKISRGGKLVVPYPKLDKETEIKIFKEIAHKSYKDVAKDCGLKELSPESSDFRLTSWIHSIVRKIMKAPELYGFSKDSVEIVRQALDSRSVRKNPLIASTKNIEAETFRDRLDSIRDKTAEMIQKKLKGFDKNKQTLDGISIRDLKDLLATAIDKSRLLRGESTENITKLSKLDVDELKPEEALKVISKAREALIEAKK